jgi:hypothetical protein
MDKLKALWRGDMRLGEAFWTWAVLGGLFVNVSTSIAFLILITNDQPIPALLVGYGIPVPYTVVALVGVWRSAARHDGSALEADLARGASAVLLAVLSVT